MEAIFQQAKFDDALKKVRGLSNPSLDREMRMAFFNFRFADAYKVIIRWMNNFHHERLRTAWRMIYG
jgi:hypothetical protein